MSFIACAPFLYIETYDLPIMYYAINQGIIIAIFSIFSMYSGRITSYLGEKICVVYGTSFLFLAGVSGSFIGFLFPGDRYDAGDALGFVEANIAYALKRDELKDRLKDYMRKILD